MTERTRGTLRIPQAEQRIPPTPRPEIDQAVADVRDQAGAWLQTPVTARLALLDRLIEDTHEVGEAWVRTACDAKGIPYDDPRAAEEWNGGPVTVLRNLRLLRSSLQDVLEHGRPRLPGEPWTRPDGTLCVPVFPTDTYDRVLFSGFTAEVWMQDHVTAENLDEHQGLVYRPGHEHEPGRVALVLGAGNVSSIGPMDVLYELFAKDRVVVLKVNPVNDYLGPFIETAFRALLQRGVLRVVYGGTDEGAYLTSHEGIDAIHMTGSDKTHDAIVWGPGEQGERNRAAGTPVLDKPITSELGNVTPVIVVPGPWSDRDLTFQAENLATMLVNNGGFNCIATRVIVQHARWARRRDLLDELRRVLATLPQRDPYYPGARERWERFLDAHPEAECFGPTAQDHVPWTLIPGVDPTAADDIVYTTEAFNGLFAETALDVAQDIPTFLERAVAFCNETLWGSLAATIVVHPSLLRDPDLQLAVDRAIAQLRYGTVVVNHWSGLGYGFVSTPWGAYPGHTIHDIQSGQGVVHNTYLLEDTLKSVVRGPFRSVPKPPWLATHRHAREVWRAGADLQADPSPAKVAPILWHAARP